MKAHTARISPAEYMSQIAFLQGQLSLLSEKRVDQGTGDTGDTNAPGDTDKLNAELENELTDELTAYLTDYW